MCLTPAEEGKNISTYRHLKKQKKSKKTSVLCAIVVPSILMQNQLISYQKSFTNTHGRGQDVQASSPQLFSLKQFFSCFFSLLLLVSRKPAQGSCFSFQSFLNLIFPQIFVFISLEKSENRRLINIFGKFSKTSWFFSSFVCELK